MTMKAKTRLSRRRRSLQYLVMIRRTATGYSVDVPDVPGCVAVAKTINSARRLITEALTYHFELMEESGETIPMPRPSIEFEIDRSSDEEFCTWVDIEIPKASAARP
jgi:predicted RNase H-like HicB family nuclease